MRILHFSFCCAAHIFRLSKKETTSRKSVRSETEERILPMFEALKTRISTWKRYNRTVAELRALSNRELSDLGILRADIERVAREAVR